MLEHGKRIPRVHRIEVLHAECIESWDIAVRCEHCGKDVAIHMRLFFAAGHYIPRADLDMCCPAVVARTAEDPSSLN